MIFLPHTNTVILLEPYCGTITVPGLPVAICVFGGGGYIRVEEEVRFPAHSSQELLGFFN